MLYQSGPLVASPEEEVKRETSTPGCLSCPTLSLKNGTRARAVHFFPIFFWHPRFRLSLVFFRIFHGVGGSVPRGIPCTKGVNDKGIQRQDVLRN